ncbi:hypothetical protein F5883DRAFT_174286 [Diaporthe sp. PMI_573]|nr:hypothetical protein F5883DRAFT_174286 [Diaporthaceae sp. PMI_573]
MGGFYKQYLDSLCRRRGWDDPKFEIFRDPSGYTCLVLVNGREYQTDLAYESEAIAEENAAMRAFMVCRNFSVNGGMLARNGIVQGLPANESGRKTRVKQSIRSTISSRASATTASDRESLSRYGPRYQDSSRSSVISSSSSDFLHGSHSDDSSPQARQQNSAVASLITSLNRHKPHPPTLEKIQQKSASPENLAEALKAQDYNKTQWLLENHFEQIAIGEYAWLTELKKLGYSSLETTDELMEKSINGPWIFEPFEVPALPTLISDFHQPNCVHNHNLPLQETDIHENNLSKTSSTDTDSKRPILSAKQIIEYLCGLCGARPNSEGTNDVEFGSVTFGENNLSAAITLIGPEDNSVVQEVLKNLEQAAGVLQQLGGCCNSFTFLYAHVDRIELYRVPFSAIQRLREQEAQKQQQPDLESAIIDSICEIMPFMAHRLRSVLDTGSEAIRHFTSLSAQFLSLALLSYAQAHCGPIRPFFLDKALDTISLAGHGNEQSNTETYKEFAVFGALVELTCMGEMTEGPVFAFHSQDGQTEGTNVFYKISSKPSLPSIDDKSQSRRDLMAFPEDILDTWGPGEMVASIEDPDLLFSVSVGGGIISHEGLPAPADLQLHWSRNSEQRGDLTRSFSRKAKVKIGGSIIENQECHADPNARLQEAVVMLEDLGTSPSFWEPAERQVGLGLQGGQAGLLAFQFNQTWVKMAGSTRKSTMLRQNAIYTANLEALFGVQVSVCTGIARRVRVRDLLADVLPAYVAGLVTKPPLWNSLNDTHQIVAALHQSDIKAWIEGLDHAHQRAFEGLVVAVLNLLGDTGIDRKSQNFVIACIQPNLPFQCFKIPCKKENYWARMLADSEETATFAYVTTQCLETCSMKCSGPAASWTNSTALFWTAVSCYEERIAAVSAMAPPDRWILKHSDAYLIGRPDAALFVQVDRPDVRADPRLLVSISTIPTEYLYRFFRKGRPGKPRRLREMKAYDKSAEEVVVLVA